MAARFTLPEIPGASRSEPDRAFVPCVSRAGGGHHRVALASTAVLAGAGRGVARAPGFARAGARPDRTSSPHVRPLQLLPGRALGGGGRVGVMEGGAIRPMA